MLRAFIRDGRLVSIPAQHKKRQVVLGYLLALCFERGRGYSEREVNDLLCEYHEDMATLRRDLVRAALMTRAAGEYRRAD